MGIAGGELGCGGDGGGGYELGKLMGLGGLWVEPEPGTDGFGLSEEPEPPGGETTTGEEMELHSPEEEEVGHWGEKRW